MEISDHDAGSAVPMEHSVAQWTRRVAEDVANVGTYLQTQIFPRTAFTLTDMCRTHVQAAAFSLVREAVSVLAKRESQQTRTVLVSRFVEKRRFSPDLLRFVYARVIEWTYLQHADMPYPGLSQTLQTRMESSDDGMSANAMAELVAQSRFVIDMEDFRYPLAELPAEHCHEIIWAVAEHMETSGAAVPDSFGEAARTYLASHDENESRLSLFVRAALAQKTRTDFETVDLSCEMSASEFFAELSIYTSVDFDRLLVISALDDRIAFAAILRSAGCSTEQVLRLLEWLHMPGRVAGDLAAEDIAAISAEAAQEAAAQWREPNSGSSQW